MIKRPTLWWLVVPLAVLAGCADRVPEVALTPAVEKTRPAAVVFWVDALDADRFWRLQRQGRLPNITRHFIDGGVQVENAAVSLPTITYANSVSLVTGLYPGHHGITGNKWFDRYSLIYEDYTFIATYRNVNHDFVPPTLYEMLPAEVTATISVPVTRGATRPIDNWMSMGVAWYFQMHETVNQLAALRLEVLSDTANAAGRWPRFILTYFPSSDSVGHKHGPQASMYAHNLEDIDRTIGQFLESLQQAGLYDTTYRALVTDHGMVTVPPRQVLPVHELLASMGICNRFARYGVGKSYEQRTEHFAEARAVVVSGGGRCSRLHLREGQWWHTRPTPEQIDTFVQRYGRLDKTPEPLREQAQRLTFPQLLANQEGVDLVAVREGDGIVRVVSKAGTSRITRRVTSEGGKEYRYQVIDGQDPLAQDACPQTAELIDGDFHSSRQWLAASVFSDRPDVVPQLPELFDSHRAGDVILFAANFWDFLYGELGAHGGLVRHEILTPFFIGGVDLPRGATIPFGRTVDLTPTMLGLMGMGDRFATVGPADGADLSAQLRAALPVETVPAAR